MPEGKCANGATPSNNRRESRRSPIMICLWAHIMLFMWPQEVKRSCVGPRRSGKMENWQPDDNDRSMSFQDLLASAWLLDHNLCARSLSRSQYADEEIMFAHSHEISKPLSTWYGVRGERVVENDCQVVNLSNNLLVHLEKCECLPIWKSLVRLELFEYKRPSRCT